MICLCLGLLTVPIYLLDQALFAGGGGGWISLDFRGLLFRSYIVWLGIELVLSSIALRLFPKSGPFLVHLGSIVLSVVLLVAGVTAYGQVRRQAVASEQQAFMDSRRPLVNIVELKSWWYVPNETNPTEIDVNVAVHDSGRFAGSVNGEQTDPSGSSTTIFESNNGPDSQRMVRKGQAFTYAFPLKTLHPGRADNVRITLYLFKAQSGPAAGDIAKVFLNSPRRDDDGEYFYGKLPAPLKLDGLNPSSSTQPR
jgi:hypothetical protein